MKKILISTAIFSTFLFTSATFSLYNSKNTKNKGVVSKDITDQIFYPELISIPEPILIMEESNDLYLSFEKISAELLKRKFQQAYFERRDIKGSPLISARYKINEKSFFDVLITAHRNFKTPDKYDIYLYLGENTTIDGVLRRKYKLSKNGNNLKHQLKEIISNSITI